ncbi:MAG: lysylphosphatidylglycerol synthase transmembrane domain-containing protein [Anaerolineae bacterium]
MKRFRIGLLGLVVSLLAIYFIAQQVDTQDFINALRQARYIYVLPTALFLLLGLVTRALRWRVLLSGGLPLKRAFSIMNVAYLVNGLLPLRIGEVARIYLATQAKPPVPYFKTASTIIVERLLDLLAIVIMTVLALGGADIPDALRVPAVTGGLSAVLGFAVLVVLARRRDVAANLLNRFIKDPALNQRLSAWLEHFLDGLQPLTNSRLFAQAVGWTAISWGFSATAGYILMLTFYPQASWAVTLLYIAAAAFAIAVPAVPGNVGPYEGSIFLALTVLGYGEPSGTALAFAVLVHGINLVVHSATGVLGFVQEGISLEQLSRGMQNMRQQQSEA